MSFRPLPDTAEALEQEILVLWDEEKTFERSLARRSDAPEFVFYEGPPTANGRPGVHHVISRTIKDVVARYRSMAGFHVTRIAGWDTHGLPVEIEAEKKLGISGKPEIEELGIARFNEECRSNIFTYQDEWERLSRRIAYWLDYARPYVTCAPDYIESVWWALAEIDKKGMLYPGYRVVPYCPRCGTGLSSHEVAQGYKDIVEPSVVVKFHLLDNADDARILSWTTTPWTLPGNLALAVGEDISYVKVRVRPDSEPVSGAQAAPGEVFILAEARLEILKHPVDVLDTFPGRELVGCRYKPLFPGALESGESETAWTVLGADFVTTEDGTGVVHTAVMYGEDDFELGKRAGLPMVHTVGEDGRFLASVPGGLAGMHVKDPATERAIRDYLSGADLLYERESYAHNYPHCWRCDSALLYMARDAWYIQTTAVRDELVENNAGVDWHPPEIGRGRMGEWLANNVDWALSRDRYWGTPLPIWQCAEDPSHRTVVGSFAELAAAAGSLPADFDPHRPGIDEIAWPCASEGCSGEMLRIPQVADAWLDSGSMPYAQWHYPFENEEEFGRHFPADFIAEGVDQTRGWFYSLQALSTILFGQTAYRSVVVNDLILDETGQKMSKSKGNVVDPWQAISEHGADAVRFYLLSASNPWLAKRWDPAGLRETNRKLFDTLRSTYRFFAMYAELEAWQPAPDGAPAPACALDHWLLSRLETVSAAVRQDLEAYDLTVAARRITAFVLDDVSNWYVRQCRDRFWATRGGEEAASDARAAFSTLHAVLSGCALLLAPFAPFLSDWLFRELCGASAHMADFPAGDGETMPDLEQEMDDVRRLSALGRAGREDAAIRVRQPLRSVRILLPGGRTLSPELADVLIRELNVQRVEFLASDQEITRLFAKPEFSKLGPVFGQRTPVVARAIEQMESDHVRRLRDGVAVELKSDGETVLIEPDHVIVREEAVGEDVVQAADGYVVALDAALDDDLIAAGRARELVNRIQRLRREADLQISDRVIVSIAGPEPLEAAAKQHRAYIAAETLAQTLNMGRESVQELEFVREVLIDDETVLIGLQRITDIG
ncbi:MAG: isoleucine--tRNA ligase [Gemmatimonadota bacterium]